MGKKKQLKEKAAKPLEETKVGKKVYSLPTNKSGTSTSSISPGGSLTKVTIPGGLEKELVDVILALNKERQIDKEISLRLTNKKLMDIYTNLSTAGFSHKQIEQAMENTILYGGDLIDALDWLCLNLSNDKLPANFSQTLQKEEEKMRPTFDASLQVANSVTNESVIETKSKVESNVTNIATKSKQNTSVEASKKSEDITAKDWILQYAEQSSDSEGELDNKMVDPNERYLELTALLLDAKEEASEVKKAGMKDKQREVSKRIREYIVEMDSLETHPDFNAEVKIKDIDSEKTSNTIEGNSQTTEHLETNEIPSTQEVDQSCDLSRSCDQNKSCDQEEEDLGLSLFAEEQVQPPEKPKESPKPVVTVKEDVRSFEYTRQQWTGKSPKQFLIDWVRKHLPKSPPPKFQKINPRGNKFKCKAIVERPKEGRLEECPEILTQNVKEAEHLAATLALYHLCKGQSVHQLLPPPYRDVWLEWLDAENQAQVEEKSKENKPRDQFLAKLLGKIQLGGKDKNSNSSTNKGSESKTLESWEDMDTIDDKDDLVTSKDNLSLKSKTVTQRDLYRKHTESEKYQTLIKQRRELPVYQHREHILDCIRKNNVVLVAGETGSGKSTQVPHFVLQDILSSPSEKCNIVCTEPRRISAISLATRVSQEMGENRLGDKESLCGYQIRFESKMGPNTCLTYCTTGVLLRKLQMDPSLNNITHVIVDEVHERSVQSDFLLIILRELLQKGSHLKVILMSATIDAEKFSSYFSHCPVMSIPGRTFPVKVFHVEDVVEETGYVLDDDSQYSLRQSELVKEDTATVAITEKGGNESKLELFWTKENLSTIDHTNLSAERYSVKTRNTITRMNFRRINMDLIVELLVYLEISDQFRDVDGAVLIFLPGLADITELYENLKSDPRFYNTSKYLIIALHSVLSSADQTMAFKIPPPGVRKIVLATNIAETGITIPDVVFVIDTGKVKENRYIESSQMNSLEEVSISKASAKQRQGRAGRVREGFCFRLFSKEMYDGFRPYTVPEILRVPLEELCLHIMKCEYGSPDVFLSKGLDPPMPQIVSRAMNLLHVIGACVEGQKLTPLGHHLAALPVHVRIGKMLLYASVFGCLEPMAVIAAAMTDKSPFIAPVGKQDLANTAKLSLSVAASDHVTMYKAYLGWHEARSKGRQSELTYCQKNYLKRNTLLEIENVKCDLIKLIDSIGFVTKTETKVLLPEEEFDKDGVLQISKYKTHSGIDMKLIAKVKAILTAGLYPNIAMVTFNAPVDAAANPETKVCIAETQQGPAHVHPSSVNRNLQANGWLVYHEKVKSTRIYLRDCSLISAYPLLLFGGEIHVQHTEQVLSVDDKIKFKAYARTGVIFRELRKLLDDVLARKLDDPKLNLTGNNLVKLIEELLVAEKSR